MFCGTSQHVVDSKNRVFVPKRIQDFLTRTATGGTQGVLTLGQDGCLYLFPVAGFQAAAAELSTRTFTDEQARAAKRTFFGLSTPVELDSSGRILIPEELRERIGLEKDIVIVGVEDRAELWPALAWKNYQREHGSVLETWNRAGASAPSANPSPGSGA
ncbi:MAG: division/cell wall cluster transcriptional repressor MraZ [Planctomycetes bacterium]|nr:division/cell wall cluster transcriptional repressor MraZ [Planctomycetota bacterium]